MKNQKNTHRFFLDKLMRDNVVDLLEKKGIIVTHRILKDNDEFLAALGEKVVEELDEVFCCENKEELIKELADLDDVLEHFKKVIGIEQAIINKARAEKVAKNGGFEKRFYCDYIDVQEGTPEYDYFLEKENKYEDSGDECDDDDECDEK